MWAGDDKLLCESFLLNDLVLSAKCSAEICSPSKLARWDEISNVSSVYDQHIVISSRCP
jgi:hypothetical protein